MLRGIALLLFLAAGHAHAVEVIRAGSYLNERSTGIRYVIKPWLEAVRADVGDAVEIREYWGGSLGRNPTTQYDLVRHGILDIAWVLPAYTSGQFPELGLFELPFLFESAEEASVVGWQLHERGLFSGFDDVHVAGLFTTEPNALFMRSAIEDVNDIDGRKIRSFGAIHRTWLNEFGASAQTMSAVDMNQAFSRDMIQGAIQGWTGMRTFGSFPLIEQAWLVPLGTTPFLILVNRKTWAQLPDAVRESMRRHGGVGIAKAGGIAYARVGAEIRSALLADGRVELMDASVTQLDRYRARTRHVHERWIRNTAGGEQLYRETRRLIEIFRHSRRSTDGR